jgi:hypothetical protein
LPALAIGMAAALRKRAGLVRGVWIAGITLFALATFGQFSSQ